ncbi:tRNA (adenosine(37)-N6)-dimethylallyltransferase MiaA [Nocardioides sp. BP30]|uniref:tRNA (adenosine(37)-N6)-dimethylallyltransferase MiaA n=1 Tax=Nocardioides sp. BP30 TaxID=3036374 RepID=UPI002468D1E4|nr:tRNA (adenosine(37)-N6)-dimethylallyltransferase MiaA [Nocardioides sp. BP30]WGL51822.1 tRNA (adenosine(37)-N6)-dimethylallyltransferase MiaA [Nocardioides sp. BP30]
MPATPSRPDDGPASVPLVAVVGATAAGKTALSLDLAERLGGEIVNTDAMQLYRGMDIGTAKLPARERRGIPHHLIDVLDVAHPATVADFQDRARTVIARLRAAETVPVLVGGSALYTRALLDRFEFPRTDAAVRERWEAELDRVGGRALHQRLAELDPVAAERIEPDNGRRVVRALEVIEITGEPFSARLPVQEYADPLTVQIGVDIDRETLDARILQRVEEMFAAGFVEEVARLLEEGLAGARTASMAIGYREVAAHLAGDLTLAEAKLRTAVKTRQFARRQDQWFRKDPRVVWVGFDAPDRVERAIAAVRSL